MAYISRAFLDDGTVNGRGGKFKEEDAAAHLKEGRMGGLSCDAAGGATS
jgi:hypothetical protein